MNEFNYYPRITYRGGGFPPSRNDRAEAALVDEVVNLANAEAAVRLRQTGQPVASIFQLTDMIELDDTPPTRDAAQAWRAEMWEPGLGLYRDGVLRVRGRDPVERPDLAGAFDLIGFSYYTCLGLRAGQIDLHATDAPVSPLGYGIYPEGLGVVLDRLHAYVPDAAFGLFDRDRNVRSSAQVLAAEARPARR